MKQFPNRNKRGDNVDNFMFLLDNYFLFLYNKKEGCFHAYIPIHKGEKMYVRRKSCKSLS